MKLSLCLLGAGAALLLFSGCGGDLDDQDRGGGRRSSYREEGDFSLVSGRAYSREYGRLDYIDGDYFYREHGNFIRYDRSTADRGREERTFADTRTQSEPVEESRERVVTRTVASNERTVVKKKTTTPVKSTRSETRTIIAKNGKKTQVPASSGKYSKSHKKYDDQDDDSDSSTAKKDSSGRLYAVSSTRGSTSTGSNLATGSDRGTASASTGGVKGETITGTKIDLAHGSSTAGKNTPPAHATPPPKPKPGGNPPPPKPATGSRLPSRTNTAPPPPIRPGPAMR